MANFNLTITNEGAAFLADVIANQGTINFSEVRFSSTNYVGSEATLTEGTFGGTFITAAPSASVMDGTTINVAASFTNATFTADKSLYSIGVIADDGNGTDYLIAVATTSTPDILSKLVLSVSTYAYNINLGVSSTANISVTASTAGAVYVADIVDDLDSYETNKPLSANQGRVLKGMIQSGALLPHIIITTDAGATVTLTLSGTSITATETSAGVYEADVDAYGTWTISALKGGITETTTVSVDTVKIYNVSITFFSATITVNYPDNMRGESFTCVNGGTTLTETAPANANTFDFHVTSTGTWTVTGAYSKPVTITTDGETQTVTFYALKTFATATDQEIADMVSEADLGFIDLADDCGWAVGQEHNVSLSAIAASGTYDGVSWSVDEIQPSQTVTFVLMQKGSYELVTPVLDKQKSTRNICSFVVGMKDDMSEKGYYNSTLTMSGSWNSSNRRNWCNAGFRSAIPADLRSAFKLFKTITADSATSLTTTTTQDYFALASEGEEFDTRQYTNEVEFNLLTQFEWYKTTSNRIKKLGGNNQGYWGRSPFTGGYTDYCWCVYGGGASAGLAPDTTFGISPFGCM